MEKAKKALKNIKFALMFIKIALIFINFALNFTKYSNFPLQRASITVHLTQVTSPFLKNSLYFVRMLVCLELRNSRYADLPNPLPSLDYAKMIDKVIQHRRNVAEARAAQPALITSADIKNVLQEFSNDPFSANSNKRWLLDVLNVRKQSRRDPECLPQIFEEAVDEFVQELSANMLTGLAVSKHTLAMLALYHRILIVWKPKSRGPMFWGPIFRMLANSTDAGRKQYLPEDMCGEDVELA
jgi:hypothetical protein